VGLVGEAATLANLASIDLTSTSPSRPGSSTTSASWPAGTGKPCHESSSRPLCRRARRPVAPSRKGAAGGVEHRGRPPGEVSGV